MSTMIKKLLLRALRSDPDFALEVWSLLAKPQILNLNRQESYIMVLDAPLNDKQVKSLTENVPADMNFAVIHGSTASLINLTEVE